MRKQTFSITIGLILVALSTPCFAVETSVVYNHLLTKYFQDQVSTEVSKILGNDRFFVKAEIKINSKLLKKEKESGTVIRLPLSKLKLDEAEFKKVSADSFGPENLHELLSMVESAQFIITLEPSVNRSMRAIIQGRLVNSLKLTAISKENIRFEDTPLEIAEYREAQISKEIEKINSFNRPSLAVTLMLTLIAITLSAMIFVIRNAGRALASKESLDHFQPSFTPIGDNTQSLQTSRNQISNQETGSIWSKSDVQLIASFIRDAEGSAAWAGIDQYIINQALSPEKSEELESLIGSNFLAPHISIEPEKAAQILQIAAVFLQGNLAEYRRINRSPIGQLASKLTLKELNQLSSKLNTFEKAILINSLSPIKKDAFIHSLSIEERLDIAKNGDVQIQASKMKAYEQSITIYLENAYSQHMTKPVEQPSFNVSYLTSGILKANTFEEDESLYLKSKELGFTYQGTLSLLDEEGNTEEWNQINLNALALAVYGYSNTVIDRFKTKLSEKRALWFSNFVSKAASGHYAFNSREVQSAKDQLETYRKNLKSKTGIKQEENDRNVA